MMTIACYGIPRVGAKPLMVVQLWKWFIGWEKGFGIDVPLIDGPLVCGLV
jgi:hypothetical protein